MTWGEGVELAKDILTLVALFGAVWSAVSFVRKIASDREAERRKNIARWLNVEIHKLIATSEKMLTVDQVVAELRKGSFVSEIEFEKSDLSEAKVRLQLLQLVERGILGQRWPDKFGITQLPFDISGEATAEMIKANRVVREAFNLIWKHPGQYDLDRLWKEVGERSEMNQSDFALAIFDLESKGVASRLENGRLQATAHSVEG
jgi:hypothetical protein